MHELRISMYNTDKTLQRQMVPIMAQVPLEFQSNTLQNL